MPPHKLVHVMSVRSFQRNKMRAPKLCLLHQMSIPKPPPAHIKYFHHETWGVFGLSTVLYWAKFFLNTCKLKTTRYSELVTLTFETNVEVQHDLFDLTQILLWEETMFSGLADISWEHCAVCGFSAFDHSTCSY